MRNFDVTYTSTITDMVDEINDRLDKGEYAPVGSIQWDVETGRYSQSIIRKTPKTIESQKTDTQQLKAKISAIADTAEHALKINGRNEVTVSIISELRKLSAI